MKTETLSTQSSTMLCPYQNQGGQTSISPPAKVKSKVLASGIDTLYLTLNVDWSRCAFLSHLGELKAKAIEKDKPVPSEIDDWLFVVQPYGRRGYEWLLESSEYTLRVGNWDLPKENKPSVVVEIRSEPLWRLGPKVAVDRILSLLRHVTKSDLTKSTVQDVKVSRADLCVDVLTPASFWSLDVLNNIVCRAKGLTPYLRNGQFTKLDGVRVGNGDILARLYDKPQEIKVKSSKVWMYDIWGIEEVPEDWRVIRVEFQLMRQAIKDLGLNTPEELFKLSANLWAYCTQQWLKFQDRPGTHHTQRHDLEWWTVVQNGYQDIQGATPLVRFKALRASQQQLMRQMYGLMTSQTALQQEQAGADIAEAASFDDCLSMLFENADLLGGEKDFALRVYEKRARNSRAYEKNAFVQELRQKLGFLSFDSITNNKGENNNE